MPATFRFVELTFRRLREAKNENPIIPKNIIRHEIDYAEICIDYFRFLPYHFELGELFVRPECEERYLSIAQLIIELAVDFEGNKNIIADACAQIDTFAIKNDIQIRHLYAAIEFVIHAPPYNENASNIMSIRYHFKNAIIAILSVKDINHKKLCIDYFDRYIISLAITGKENALKCHKDEKRLYNRLPNVDKYVIQSLGDPDFNMKDFLTKSPITMFFEHSSAIVIELYTVATDLHYISALSHTDYFKTEEERENWLRVQCFGYFKNLVSKIHGIPKKANLIHILKQKFPDGNLCMIRLLTRPS